MDLILDNPELSAGIITAIVLIVALIFAYRQLKGMSKDRHAQILMGLSNNWRSDTMQHARVCLAKNFGDAQKQDPQNPEGKLAEMITEYREKEPAQAVELVQIADFFEDMGLLVNKKLIHPPDLVLEIFAGSIIFYWGKYEEYTHALRLEFQRQDIYEWFGYLYRLAKAYSEAKSTYQGPPENRPTAKRLFRRLSKIFS